MKKSDFTTEQLENMDLDKWEEIFSSPGWSEIVRCGTLLKEKISKDGKIKFTAYEYDGKKYGMLWNIETGRNMSYDDLDEYYRRYPWCKRVMEETK